jgi:hypothetical protein
MQRANTNGFVIGYDLVMFSANLRRYSDVRTFLTSNRIAKYSQRLDQCISGHIARQFHPGNGSARQNFIAHKMQADNFWTLGGFVEITIHRLPNIGAQGIKSVRLGVNPETKCGSSKSTIGWIFAHFKNHFAHCRKTLG